MMIKQSSELVVEFLNRIQFRLKGLLADIDYKNLKYLVIMGHSIEADFEIFTEIIENAINLKKYILFTFSGESKESLNYKKEILKSMKDIPVEIEYY